uniref:Tubulin-specific chaperone e-like n=1 Tax=Tetraselmis sp. GSL018 TaxID=582737 RepID=A0A061RZB9_9CHLO
MLTLEEGLRVRNGRQGCPGTVRFVGTLHGREGHWAGVEWDDPERGKHDGTLDGISYFKCIKNGTPASFVRVDKLDTGVSLGLALRDRYESFEESPEAQGDRTENFGKVYGAEKLAERQSLKNLKVASLRFVGVFGVRMAGNDHGGDAAAELSAACPVLEELDLSGNLLSSWAQVAEVADCLPSLRALNLTGNVLRPTGSTLPRSHGMAQLSVLVLNSTGVSWEQICRVGPAMTNLRELHLNGNGITSLAAAPAEALCLLRHLSLEDNELSDWGGVESAVGELPRLERLHLSGNCLPAVHPPKGDHEWRCLKAITLGRNRIGSWSSIDALDRFPSLGELRLSGNPLLEGARSGGRFEVIARVAKLELLNGSKVTRRERQDAELRYLRTVWGELQSQDAHSRAEVEDANPRLAELLERHGPMSSAAAGAGGSLASQMVQVNLTCVAAKAGPSMGTKPKKLPGTTTVAQLRSLCSVLFKLDPEEVGLYLRFSPEAVPEAIAGDDSTPIEHFCSMDGLEIIVSDSVG